MTPEQIDRLELVADRMDALGKAQEQLASDMSGQAAEMWHRANPITNTSSVTQTFSDGNVRVLLAASFIAGVSLTAVVALAVWVFNLSNQTQLNKIYNETLEQRVSALENP